MKIVNTRDTMSPIYLDSVKIRHKVFVEEQNVPLTLEIDQNEAFSVHFVLYDDNNNALATARLLPNKDDEKLAKLQRMAVLKEARGKYYGKDVVLAIESFATEHGFNELHLHAQIDAQDFYKKLGYKEYGERFMDAGIEHIAMMKKL
jgi:predicted GNAT family N-acyltransferase